MPGPTFVTIDYGDRLGIVFPTDDGGTKLVYLMRNLEDRVLSVLNGRGDLTEDSAELPLCADFADPDVAEGTGADPLPA